MKLVNRNIRSRIAVYFTLLTSIILISLSIAVYYFSARYSHQEFFNRMAYHADLVAQLHPQGSIDFTKLNEEGQDFLIEEHEQILILGNIRDAENAKGIPSSVLRGIVESGLSTYQAGSRFYYGQTYDQGGEKFTVIINAIDTYGESKLSRLATILVLSTCIALLLVFFVSRWLAKRSLIPLEAVIHDFKDFENAPWQQRLKEEDKPQEVAALAQAFNRLQDKISAIIQTQHNFISNASHELKTPLTVIVGEAEVILQKERSAEQYRKSLERIHLEGSRLQTLTLRLLRLAQTGFSNEPPKFEEIDLVDMMVVLQVEYHKTQSNSVQFAFPETSRHFRVMGHPGLLKIAINNLIENGLKFSNASVGIQLSLTEDYIRIDVSDSGRGIPDEAIPHLYEPFYRAQNARSVPGFGIGLPLTQNILRIHSGNLSFTSRIGEGTTAHVTLPRNI